MPVKSPSFSSLIVSPKQSGIPREEAASVTTSVTGSTLASGVEASASLALASSFSTSTSSVGKISGRNKSNIKTLLGKKKSERSTEASKSRSSSGKISSIGSISVEKLKSDTRRVLGSESGLGVDLSARDTVIGGGSRRRARSGGSTGAGDPAVSVFTYDATVFDSEIINKGVTSAFPEIIGILPMQNLYSSGKPTNTGILFDIQNAIKDRSVKQADKIVNDYYAAYPAISSSLASIRDENISKYNNIFSTLTKILDARKSIISAYNSNLSSTESIVVYNSMKNAWSNTMGYSIEGEATSTGGVEYYSENSFSSLQKRLIGIDDNVQTYSTRQYQLVKAAIAQCLEGRRFDPASFSYYVSPYAALESATVGSDDYYIKILPINAWLAGNFDPTLDNRAIASDTLDLAGRTISGRTTTVSRNTDIFVPPLDLNLNSADSITDYYNDRSLVYAGDIAFEGTSYTILNNSNSERDGFDLPSSKIVSWYKETDDDESYILNLPIVGVNIGDITSEFISQGFVSLAAEIATTKKPITLPKSIDPNTSDPISVIDTTSDQVRFVVKAVSGDSDKNLFLFDDFLKNDTDYNGLPISTVIQATSDELSDIKSKITQAYDDIVSFADDTGHVFWYQNAITLQRIIYGKIKELFTNSVLSGQKDSDVQSASRIAMFVIAANNSIAAGKLFRVIDEGSDNLVRRIAAGKTIEIESDGSQVMKFFGYPDTVVLGEGGGSESSGASEFNTTSFSTGGISSRGSNAQKNLEFAVDEVTISDFIKGLFDSGGSFFKFKEIIDEVQTYFPVVTDESALLKKIKYFSYIIFLRLLKKMEISGSFKISSYDTDLKSDTYDSSEVIFYGGNLKWYLGDAGLIADYLNNAFSLDDLDASLPLTDEGYDYFSSFTGAAPTQDQITSAGYDFWSLIRSPVRFAIQCAYDFRFVLSYQLTVFQNQITAIDTISTLKSALSSYLDGDETLTSQVISRYLSLESVVEAYYRSQRYQSFIPDTNISTIARRSKNFRSIIRSAFKQLIPNSNDLKICIIGIPYGHLERLRLALDSEKYYFSMQINGDAVSTEDDEEKRIDYPFGYIDYSDTYRPNLAGPFPVLIPDLYDNFDSTSVVTSVTDSSISFYRMSEDGTSFDIYSGDELSETFKNIDMRVSIIQAALQSYVEDVYGLYPRFASTKGDMQTDPYPEEAYADDALKFSGFTRNNEDEELIYARLKSTIMMHRDFITSMMLDELKASPLFDKIVYMLVDTTSSDIVSEFYTKMEV